jgi:hypothetical protein
MFPTLPSVLIRVIRGQILLLSVLSVSSVVKLLPLTISQFPFSIRVICDWKRIRNSAATCNETSPRDSTAVNLVSA